MLVPGLGFPSQFFPYIHIVYFIRMLFHTQYNWCFINFPKFIFTYIWAA